jgi:hypothetical protein
MFLGLGVSLSQQGSAGPSSPRVTTLEVGEYEYVPLVPGVSRYWASHPQAGQTIPDTEQGQEDARGRYELIALRNPVTTGGASWWGVRASTSNNASLTDTTTGFWARMGNNRLPFSTRLAGGGQDFARIAHGVAEASLSFATPIITIDVPAYAPNRAATPTVTSPSAGTLRVVIGTAPASNGSAITSIEVRRSPNPDMSGATTATVLVANRATPQDYTVAGGVWYVDVREVNGVGPGPRSAIASAVVDGSLAAPPQQSPDAFFLRGGSNPAVFFVGPFTGAAITTGTIRVYASGQTDVDSHILEIEADSGFQDENGAVEYLLPDWTSGDYVLRGRVENATGPSPWSEPTAPVSVTSGLSLSVSNGSVVISGISNDAEEIIIEVVDTDPAAFNGTYTISLADLDDGLELLASPIISGTAEVGETGTGTRALWVYDPAAYTGAPLPFQTLRNWRLNGANIEGANDFTLTFPTPGAYTFVESGATPTGGFLDAISNEIEIDSSITLAAVPMNGRRIDLSGIITNGRRFVMVAHFGAARTAGAAQSILSSTASGAIGNQPITLHINSAGTIAARSQAASEAIGTATTSNAVATADPIETLFVHVADMDRAGGSLRFAFQGVNAVNSRVASMSGVAAPGDVSLPLSDLVFGARPDGATGLHADTTLKFLWIATDLPPVLDNDLRTARDLIRDALFMSTSPGFPFVPRDFAANGRITIGNTVIDPVVFLAGAQLGQYDAGAGVTRLNNRGTGADPILIGGVFP